MSLYSLLFKMGNQEKIIAAVHYTMAGRFWQEQVSRLLPESVNTVLDNRFFFYCGLAVPFSHYQVSVVTTERRMAEAQGQTALTYKKPLCLFSPTEVREFRSGMGRHSDAFMDRDDIDTSLKCI